jgi:hypothetical protein
MSNIEEAIQNFRKEYKEAYNGILSYEVLEQGNPWFENKLRELAKSLRSQIIEEIRIIAGTDEEVYSCLSKSQRHLIRGRNHFRSQFLTKLDNYQKQV